MSRAMGGGVGHSDLKLTWDCINKLFSVMFIIHHVGTCHIPRVFLQIIVLLLSKVTPV